MEVRAKKSLGQHFLTDGRIAKAIVDALLPGDLPAGAAKATGVVGAVGNDGASGRVGAGEAAEGLSSAAAEKATTAVAPAVTDVLEIGPGMGVLTQFLLERKDISLKLVELDGESVQYLLTHFQGMQGRLFQADYLKLDTSRLFPGRYAVIGNFPYNISSQIFFKILDDRDNIPQVVCMIQKEVAERIAAPPGSKTYGILSVLLQAWYDIEYLFTVEPGAFAPPPKVRSAVIRLQRNSRTTLGEVDEKFFRQVVKTAFNQRRKTLKNALKSLIPQGTDTSAQIYSLRAENLGVEDFIRISEQFSSR